MAGTGIYIEGYGAGNGTGWDQHRVNLVLSYPGGETRLAIGLEAPLPEGEEGESILRKKLLASADAIQEVVGSDREIFWHNRPRT